MVNHNKTLDWLGGKSGTELDDYIEFGKSMGHKMQKDHLEQKRELEKEKAEMLDDDDFKEKVSAFFGQGGWKIHQARNFYNNSTFRALQDFAPHIVILWCGCNDIDQGLPPLRQQGHAQFIAIGLIDLAQAILASVPSCTRVIIMNILPRYPDLRDHSQVEGRGRRRQTGRRLATYLLTLNLLQ